MVAHADRPAHTHEFSCLLGGDGVHLSDELGLIGTRARTAQRLDGACPTEQASWFRLPPAKPAALLMLSRSW